MTIECPICDSRSAASQKRLREIARLGIARLLTVAHKAGVELTTEQQRQIFESSWNGIPRVFRARSIGLCTSIWTGARTTRCLVYTWTSA